MPLEPWARIELNDDLVGIWFVSFADGTFLAGLSKDSKGFELRSRFHIHKTGELKWVLSRSEHNFSSTLNKVRTAINGITRQGKGGQQWEMLKGDKTLEAFAKEIAAHPFSRLGSIATDSSQTPYLT